MNPIEEIKTDHQKFERDFLELETILEDSVESVINYSNLVHMINKFSSFWDLHEQKEEKTFQKLKENGFKIPISKILITHTIIRVPLESIKKAINSGNDFKVRKSLEKDLKDLIKKIRLHMKAEDEILYTLPKEVIEKL